MEKRNKFIALVALAALIVSAVPFTLVACNSSDEINSAQATSFVSVDINPSVELVLDENNTVLSVSAANSDAEVLLWNEDGVVGANVNVAIGKIATLAVNYNYITIDNKTVSVSIAAGANVDAEALYNSVASSISSAVSAASSAIGSTITAAVENTADIVLTKELARVKENNAGKAGYDDSLTVAKYRLVKRAMACDRKLKMDTAVQMSVEALSEIVTACQSRYDAKLGEIYALAVSEAQFNYTLAKDTLSNAVYADIDPLAALRDDFDPSKVIEQLLNGYYGIYKDRAGDEQLDARKNGAQYMLLNLAYDALDHYYSALRDYIDNPIIDEEDLLALFNAIGTTIDAGTFEDFKDAVTDENGDIRLKDVKAELNFEYRNMSKEERAEFSGSYTAVLSFIDGVDFDATAVTNGNFSEFSAMLSSTGIGASFNDYNWTAAEEVENALTALKSEVDDKFASLNLTDAEKERIAEAQKGITAKLDEYKETFDNAVQKASEAARTKLAELKLRRVKTSQEQNSLNAA